VDAHRVDCNVTGIDIGSSDKPKSSLLTLFCDVVFPKGGALVSQGGGNCERCLPVIHRVTRMLVLTLTVLVLILSIHSAEEHGWHWEGKLLDAPRVKNIKFASVPAMC
jgi:hypothetical protein